MTINVMVVILFAHRISSNSSSNYSLFILRYNREPLLSFDIKYDVNETLNDEELLIKAVFDAVFFSVKNLLTLLLTHFSPVFHFYTH